MPFDDAVGDRSIGGSFGLDDQCSMFVVGLFPEADGGELEIDWLALAVEVEDGVADTHILGRRAAAKVRKARRHQNGVEIIAKSCQTTALFFGQQTPFA